MQMMGKKSKTPPPRAGRSNTTSRDDGNTPHLPPPRWSPQSHVPNQDLQCDLCESVLVWASLVAQMAKNPPTMQDTWTLSLGQDDPLEKETVAHSRTLDRPATVRGVATTRTRLTD